MQEDTKDKEAVQLLGLSYYLAGPTGDAIPLLEQVQGWFPRANVDASYILGIAYIQNKQYPQARAAFARMFDVSADSAASYLFTARMLLRQEFDPVAEEYAQKAIALDGKLPMAHFFLGELHFISRESPRRLRTFSRNWRSIRDMQPRITSWRMLTRGCRNSTMPSGFYNEVYGWMRRRQGRTF